MRHIWQHEYAPDMNENHAAGFGDALIHEAEIDADGYAIWYLSYSPNMNIEEAASIMCPVEKTNYPEAFRLRIEKAIEINQQHIDSKKPERKLHSFLTFIKNIFKFGGKNNESV